MEAGDLVAWLPIVGFLAAIVLVERLLSRWTQVFGSCAGWWRRRWRRLRPEPPKPIGRPIEMIARDARRIGCRFHRQPDGLRFAKIEGLRRAYDDVLVEACDALGVDHLLGILPPGTDRDLERGRVEWMLHEYGLDLPDAA